MTVQCQPSSTSCGPTVVAMLVGVPVSDMLSKLPTVRTAKRARKRTHGTNIGELTRLLKPFGRRIGRRLRDALPVEGSAILRVTRAHSRNWHWMLLKDGLVYDTNGGVTYTLASFAQAVESRRVSWYAVEEFA